MSDVKVTTNPVIQKLSVTGVDGKSAATTTVGTTQAGLRFYPLYAVVNVSTADTIAVACALSIGTNGTDLNDVLAITTMTGLTAANTSLRTSLGLTALGSVAPSTAVKVKITTGATATTCTLDVHVFGFYA